MIVVRALIGAVAIGVLTTSGAIAHSWLAECTIRFDNEFALTWVYGQARATFASHTGLSATGKPEVCDPAKHIACWTYRERCGSRGYVNVEEAPIGRYGHFHLSFENPALNNNATLCFVDPGDGFGSGFGSQSGTTCTAVDWKREPRHASGHEESHFIRLWVEDRVTHASINFDVASIRIRGPAAGQVWFRKTDGRWWYWPRLAPGNWNVSAWTWDITDLYVRAAAGEGAPVFFDDVVVRN
jgi:hypothetical protein